MPTLIKLLSDLAQRSWCCFPEQATQGHWAWLASKLIALNISQLHSLSFELTSYPHIKIQTLPAHKKLLISCLNVIYI